MKLGFVYYNPENLNFKKHSIRYNTLLKNFFESNNPTIVCKLSDELNNVLNEAASYEILNQKESEVYNSIIEFLGNSLNDEEIAQVKSMDISQDIKERIAHKITNDLPNIEQEVINNIIEKSQNIIKGSDMKNIEIIFIPSGIED